MKTCFSRASTGLGLVTVVILFGCSSDHSSTPPVSNVSVTISPASANLMPNRQQLFTAAVSNASDTSVTWEVNGTPGGTAGTGTIDNSGIYTAPATAPNQQGTVVVEAVSNADP